jgi:multidrug resistance efflux pump
VLSQKLNLSRIKTPNNLTPLPFSLHLQQLFIFDIIKRRSFSDYFIAKEIRQMFSKRRFLFVLAVFLFVLAQNVCAAEGLVEQVCTLSGRVSAVGLVARGDDVQEGQPLLRVDGIAGPAVAARATVSGAVAEILVKPGDIIKSGQIIVRIRPSA